MRLKMAVFAALGVGAVLVLAAVVFALLRSA
jgi:hypothetical protein